MARGSLCARQLAAVLVISVAALSPLSAQAQAPDKPPDVTANADGSCTYHKHLGGAREDIRVENGATYHQEEKKGEKSGVIFVPDRTYLCKDGHLTRQNTP
jgi:hypothetical protein